jgi:hypothetical protein
VCGGGRGLFFDDYREGDCVISGGFFERVRLWCFGVRFLDARHNTHLFCCMDLVCYLSWSGRFEVRMFPFILPSRETLKAPSSRDASC